MAKENGKSIRIVLDLNDVQARILYRVFEKVTGDSRACAPFDRALRSLSADGVKYELDGTGYKLREGGFNIVEREEKS